MKSKEYYVKKYEKRWNKCYEKAKKEVEKDGGDMEDAVFVATDLYDDTANAEEVAGEYIKNHGEYALNDWLVDMKGQYFSSLDREVDSILKRLYK